MKNRVFHPLQLPSINQFFLIIKPLGMQTKILETVSIDLQILKREPPILDIIAIGNVTSSGWKHGRLVPYIYITPPADGIYEFDFVAEPPTGPALTVILPIVAQGQWEDFPPDLKGVKIYSSSNSLVATLDNAKEAAMPEGGGSGNPRGLFTS
jgi:hypothetical protein